MKNIPAGAHGRAEVTVAAEQTLAFHHPDLPPVFSTPHMIALMETAAYHALHPFHAPGEITVGTAINIEHVAACSVGAHVVAEAKLARVEGKLYVFNVTATATQNGREWEIGHGTVTRAFVHVARFMQKLSDL